MRTVNIHEAKMQLSELIEAVENGEEVVIARASRPVARLTRLEPAPEKRRLGTVAGKISIADDFDAPLPLELIESFEGQR